MPEVALGPPNLISYTCSILSVILVSVALGPPNLISYTASRSYSAISLCRCAWPPKFDQLY